MRITQGCFSFLPDLTDEQIRSQVQYALDKGWAVNLEFTGTTRIRATPIGTCGVCRCSICATPPASCPEHWRNAAGSMATFISACRLSIVRMDGNRCASPSSSIVQPMRTGFRLERQEGRRAQYPLHATRPYATDRPEGKRYS